MTMTRFRPITIAEVSDADIDSINDSLNVPQLLRPGTQLAPDRRQPVEPSRHDDGGQAKPAPAPREGKLTIRVPVTLNESMKRDAIDQRCHVRTIVLSALESAGYRLPKADVTAAGRAPVIPPRRQTVIDDGRTGPSPQQKLSIDMPDAYRRMLKRRALEQGVPVRIVILTALKDYGYSIAAADLAPGAGGNC